MTVTSNSHIKRKVSIVTLLLFMLGAALFVKADVSTGLSDPRDVFSVLAASYLIAWGGYALISSIPRDEIRSQFVLLTISLMAAVFLAEVPVWCDLIDYRRAFSTTSPLPWEQPNFVPDHELLALPKPHSVVKTVFGRGNIGEEICLPMQPAEPFEVKYDKHGFRNKQDYTAAEVVVIGDSYVESPMMPSSVLATTRLAELQRKSVANFGQSGFGPQQELTVLRRYALPLRPKWIVWMFYEGNDLVDAQRYTDRVSFLNSIWGSLDAAWDRSFTRNLLAAVAQVSQGCVPNKRVAGNFGTVSGEDGREYRMYFVDHTTSVIPAAPELAALQKTGEIIKAGFELAQSEGARFMVVFAPTKYRVYHDIAKFDGNSSGDIKWWELNDLPERLLRIVTDISPDIRYVDLTPALRLAAKKKQLVFIPDDTHWASEGHRVVAESLDQALRNNSQTFVAGGGEQERAKDRVRADLGSGAMMVRNKDGTIRYWSEGAREMYGWEKRDALGSVSHRLLKTVFPAPLETIEAELLARGYWEGRLIHERSNGTKVSVSSRWELQQDPNAKDQSVTVVEINQQAS